MANRVLLDVNGLLVSKPTFDVLTTTENNLLFSSDYHKLGFSFKGAIQLTGYSTNEYLSFGKTFTTPPYVFFMYSPSSLDITTEMWVINQASAQNFRSMYSFYVAGSNYRYHLLDFTVSVDGVTVVYNSYTNMSSGFPNAALTGWMTVMATEYNP